MTGARSHRRAGRFASPLLGLAVALVCGPARAEPSPSRVTAVIFLKHMPATRAVAIYERVLGRIHGALASPGRDNRSVTVRDAPQRVDRFRKLLAKLDLPGAELRVFVRPVLHRRPRELEQLITEVLKAKKTRAPVTMVADSASRQLVVCTTRRVYFHIIDPLARKLDQKQPVRRSIRTLPAPRKYLEATPL